MLTNGAGLHFAKFWVGILPPGVSANIKRRVLREICPLTDRHATCNKKFAPCRIARPKTNCKNPMSTLTAKGNWNIAKGKLKQMFAELTDDDLQFIAGKKDELIGRIQKRTGQARDAIERAVDECCGGKR